MRRQNLFKVFCIQAYRIIFQTKLPLSQALDRAEDECEELPEVLHFVTFIRSSERGVTS